MATIEIAPDPATVFVQGTVQLQVSARDGSDALLENPPLFWSSQDSMVAAVSAEGVVSGRSPGTVQVAASSGGVSAVATVNVQPRPVASVSVSPADTTITVDEEVTFSATSLDAQGRELRGRPVSWASSAPEVATVEGNGRVIGVSAGTAEISATVEGMVGRSTIQVSRKAVESVEVDPPAAALLLGQEMQFTAVALAADGSELSGLEVRWTSSNSSIARVSASGLVTARTVGAANITATIEGKTATVGVGVGLHPVASLTVSPASAELPVGDDLVLEAIPRAANGAVLTGRSTSWSSSSTAVATVSSSGRVTAVAPGTATITARSEGRSGTASVRVVEREVESVEVTPGTLSLVAGSSGSLSAVVRDDEGSRLAGRSVTWRSSSQEVATVDSDGRVTAVAPGTATITATSEGVDGTATVTVTPRPVETVEVSPESLSLLVGDSATLSAELRASDGTVLTGSVSWSTSDGGIARVTADGRVTAVAPGEATITATSGGVSGEAQVTVAARPVATVEISPSSLTLDVGAVETLQVNLQAEDGTELSGRAVTWSSSEPEIATVDESGRVTGVAPGEATVTATSEGVSGTATITVQPPAVATVEVAPPALTLVVGEAGTLEAIVRAADGTILADREVTWASGAPEVATVDASGTVTAVAAGEATITATSEGVDGEASVTVSLEPVDSVEVTPPSISLFVDEVEALEVVLRDGSGAILEGREVEWSSSDESIATVDANGTVTAHAAGTVTITATSEGVGGQATVQVLPIPALLAIVSGNDQVGGNNTTLRDSLVVVVRDALDQPIEGVRVVWDTESGSVSPVEALSAADGTARTAWTTGGGGIFLPRYAWAEVEGLPRALFTATRW